MNSFYINLVKPLFDYTFSLLAFLLISPLFLVLIIVISIYFSGSPFFLQERPGKKGRIFKVIKFKSMNDKVDKNGTLLPVNERITSLGKFIRLTSLDELPQLINIIKGEMSFIGPRPLLTSYLPLYNEFQNRRHEIKPGITGLAQVNGRNAITWEDKFKLDVYYVDHLSFILDLKIIWKTIIKVIKQEGVGQVGSQVGSVFYEPFTGNNN